MATLTDHLRNLIEGLDDRRLQQVSAFIIAEIDRRKVNVERTRLGDTLSGIEVNDLHGSEDKAQ